MSKVLKGLISGALALSLMSPITKGDDTPAPGTAPAPAVETYSVGNVLKNSWFAKFGLAGMILAIGETGYIIADKVFGLFD